MATYRAENDDKPALRPTASWATIATIGVVAIIMGVSFVLLRPLIVLLPEDQRFTGMTPDQLKALNGQLFAWIGMVFRSWGAFAIGLGTMIAAVAALHTVRENDGHGGHWPSPAYSPSAYF